MFLVKLLRSNEEEEDELFIINLGVVVRLFLNEFSSPPGTNLGDRYVVVRLLFLNEFSSPPGTTNLLGDRYDVLLDEETMFGDRTESAALRAGVVLDDDVFIILFYE